ncbi:MAG: hypothetical protein FWF46_00225 [Oscillospiraceae bacterium]|nr:hypothetical protein [Oscillospiraceae bacterium]
MKTVGFIGIYDKTDIMLYTAKILTILNRKTLIIDSSIMQKAKYVIPTINPTHSYVTEFEKIDIAVGFSSMEELRNYLGYGIQDDLGYDIVLIDIDTADGFSNFEMHLASNTFFVTAFDAYSLKRGLEILSGLEISVIMTKILISRKVMKEDNQYLDYLSKDYKIRWNEQIINYVLTEHTLQGIIDNQKAAKIKFKNIGQEFVELISTIIMAIIPEITINDIVKAIKTIDKGGY